MRLLESAPARYDRDIRLLTLGQVERAYDRLTAHIQPGWQVLDLGTGTGRRVFEGGRLSSLPPEQAGKAVPHILLLHAGRCEQCGACIVQCPTDALAFVPPGGEQVPPEAIRRYKLNLLGRRGRSDDRVAGRARKPDTLVPLPPLDYNRWEERAKRGERDGQQNERGDPSSLARAACAERKGTRSGPGD